MRKGSQSYSCWYWVLSRYGKNNVLSCKESQSYSCWYWVLSFFYRDVGINVSIVSILFLLVLGSVGSKIPIISGGASVSILSLLVLGSVLELVQLINEAPAVSILFSLSLRPVP